MTHQCKFQNVEVAETALANIRINKQCTTHFVERKTGIEIGLDNWHDHCREFGKILVEQCYIQVYMHAYSSLILRLPTRHPTTTSQPSQLGKVNLLSGVVGQQTTQSVNEAWPSVRLYCPAFISLNLSFIVGGLPFGISFGNYR